MQVIAACPEFDKSSMRAGIKCFNQKNGPRVKHSEGSPNLSLSFLDAGKGRETAKGELNKGRGVIAREPYIPIPPVTIPCIMMASCKIGNEKWAKVVSGTTFDAANRFSIAPGKEQQKPEF